MGLFLCMSTISGAVQTGLTLFLFTVYSDRFFRPCIPRSVCLVYTSPSHRATMHSP